MITVEQAQEIFDAMNAYGDAERIFGVREQQKLPDYELGKANRRADKALGEVTALLRPHLAEPDHPGLNGKFSIPEPDDSEVEPDTEEWFEPPKYLFEK